MRIILNYGKGQISLDLPDRWDVTVIRKPPMPVLRDEDEAVMQTLASPIGSRTRRVRNSKTWWATLGCSPP